MATQEVNNGKNHQDAITTGYISIKENQSDPLLPPLINSYYEDGGSSWLFSSHDIPILIGAAAGAIGLIIIFLLGALIWHCCQFVLQREKSSYSLDNESEKNSVSSRGSNLYINNPINSSIIDEKCVVRENSDQNLKRSISAPLHKGSAIKPSKDTHLQQQQKTPIILTNELKKNMSNDKSIVSDYIEDMKNKNEDSVSVGMELTDNKRDNEIESHRSHIYLTNPILDDEEVTVFKSRSLPWNQSNKRRVVSIDDELQEEFQTKINFSKKRKNRMRNDSAAAIAMNRSGTDPNSKMLFAHKDTDTLVDNEAIVVYDERTAL